jgi:hypothetical protein
MGLAPPFSPKAKRLCFLFSHLACSCRTANHVDMECSTACRTKCPEAFLSLSRELKSNSQCTAQLWIGKAKGGRAPRHRGQDERGGNQREQQHTKKKSHRDARVDGYQCWPDLSMIQCSHRTTTDHKCCRRWGNAVWNFLTPPWMGKEQMKAARIVLPLGKAGCPSPMGDDDGRLLPYFSQCARPKMRQMPVSLRRREGCVDLSSSPLLHAEKGPGARREWQGGWQGCVLKRIMLHYVRSRIRIQVLSDDHIISLHKAINMIIWFF